MFAVLQLQRSNILDKGADFEVDLASGIAFFGRAGMDVNRAKLISVQHLIPGSLRLSSHLTLKK